MNTIGGPPTTRPTRPRTGRAAWALLLLAPISAELMFSAVGMPIMWLAFPLLIPLYGAGVLLVREATVRVGGGWPTLIVLGLVYELAEDGLGLQALTSPHLYNAAAWGPRVLGFNTTYWESQAGYHTVFSVLIPIVLTNLIFPELRTTSYLRRRGMIGIAITTAVGVVLLKIGFTTTTDPGYFAPLPFLFGLLIVMAALCYLALKIIPQRIGADWSPFAGRLPTRVPPAPVTGLVAGLATLVFLSLLMPMESPPTGPAWGTGGIVWLPMAFAAAVAIGTGIMIARWVPSMSDLHRIWLVGGALVAHTAYVVLTVLVHPGGTLRLVLAVTTGPILIILTVVLLAALARKVARRTSD
ncbi:hypothetical protein [Microlunatus soli]|uniref:Uncharacterized protein n=1 Tax=Microlunatus soli TaxID=630515 RepID=A0A1H2A591_9ACTN|nr:hypothetical protein [Microlunatus soli]SDT41059.1 hypothetical protein SAMN04489812_5673 [Microlunatus soli]